MWAMAFTLWLAKASSANLTYILVGVNIASPKDMPRSSIYLSSSYLYSSRKIFLIKENPFECIPLEDMPTRRSPAFTS